jgi:hypothetical protein
VIISLPPLTRLLSGSGDHFYILINDVKLSISDILHIYSKGRLNATCPHRAKRSLLRTAAIQS